MAVLSKSLQDIAAFFGLDNPTEDDKTPYDSISARPVPSPGPPPVAYGPPPPPDGQPVPYPSQPPIPYDPSQDDNSQPVPTPGPPPIAGTRSPQSVDDDSGDDGDDGSYPAVTNVAFKRGMNIDLSKKPTPSPTPSPANTPFKEGTGGKNQDDDEDDDDAVSYKNLIASGKLGPMTDKRASVIQAIMNKANASKSGSSAMVGIPPYGPSPGPVPLPGPAPIARPPFGPITTGDDPLPAPPSAQRYPTATPTPSPMPPLPGPPPQMGGIAGGSASGSTSGVPGGSLSPSPSASPTGSPMGIPGGGGSPFSSAMAAPRPAPTPIPFPSRPVPPQQPTPPLPPAASQTPGTPPPDQPLSTFPGSGGPNPADPSYVGNQLANGLPPLDDLNAQRAAIIGANAIGNYSLAGADIARGALTPLDGHTVGNAINNQNAQLLNDFQQSNNRRLSVMQFIAAQQNAAALAQGRNQNALAIAGVRAAAPKGNPNAQSNFERMMALRQQGLDSRNEQSANQFFSVQTAPYVQSMDSSNRLRDVLNNVKSGNLISSANVAASMSNDMAQLLTNSKNTTVSDKDHAAINSLDGTYNQIVSYAKNKPTNTIPQAYLDQFEKELGILEQSNAVNYQNKVNELKSGTTNPSKQNVYQNRYNARTNPQPSPSPGLSSDNNSGFPRQVSKSDGTTATVSNQQEADEAASEGFQ